MPTFADHVIEFNRALEFEGTLPPGIRVMNPFRENPGALEASSRFYRKYYDDGTPRRIILGINPGRFGAGLTGVPFTDPKRLVSECGIEYPGPPAHEPSSAFIYAMIARYGGPAAFYRDFYINSLCPLGFTALKPNGKEVNYNYYDSKELAEAARPFMLACLKKQLEFSIRRDVCFCLGTGKNAAFITALNQEHGFFDRIVPLEHPRYVIQYKTKQKQAYIDKYLEAFREAEGRG